MVMFWIAVLVISTLLYVLLNGFDLGIGILFGLTRVERQTSRHDECHLADLRRQ